MSLVYNGPNVFHLTFYVRDPIPARSELPMEPRGQKTISFITPLYRTWAWELSMYWYTRDWGTSSWLQWAQCSQLLLIRLRNFHPAFQLLQLSWAVILGLHVGSSELCCHTGFYHRQKSWASSCQSNILTTKPTLPFIWLVMSIPISRQCLLLSLCWSQSCCWPGRISVFIS